MSKTKSCKNETTSPTALGIAEGQDAFWESALGLIACRIDRLTYDETHRCWNALLTLTEDLDWHKAGKQLATHLSKISKERGDE